MMGGMQRTIARSIGGHHDARVSARRARKDARRAAFEKMAEQRDEAEDARQKARAARAALSERARRTVAP
jgi:hypothetical protein